MLAFQNLRERLDGISQRDVATLVTGKDLGRCEGLGHETLDFTGTLDSQFVLLGELIHSQNGNDVLERLVVLENLLDTSGDTVVLVTHNSRVEDTGLGVKRVDGRVNTQLGNGTRQDSCGVQVSKSGSGSRIRQVISRDVNGLVFECFARC